MINLGRHSHRGAEQYDDAFWERSAEIHVRARFPIWWAIRRSLTSNFAPSQLGN